MSGLEPKDCFALYRNIFHEECQAIIKSKEYAESKAGLSKDERNKIKKNQEKIAEYAARYYIGNYGSNLVDEAFIKRAVRKSINMALKNFR